MKEWMVFQGFEDILQILGSLYRDPDGRMDKYEPYVNTEGKQTFLSQHIASNLSFLSHWDREFTSKHHLPTPKVAWVNLTKEEFQQLKIHPEVGQTIMNFNTTKRKFFSDDRKFITEYNKKIPPKTWSPSSGNTKTLPNTPTVPDGGKSKGISCHQDKKKEFLNQIILPLKKHLAKINSCSPWFMKPSMPLLTTHLPILTKYCLSTELSGVPITPPLIFIMSCLQERAILLTPTLPLMKIH